MKILVGLGNIGDTYVNTRHNIGFIIVERLSSEYQIPFKDKTPHYIAGCGSIQEKEVVLAEPQNYMNRSGIAVKYLMRQYELSPADILVIHDDIDLSLGSVKKKEKGGDGGHRGIRSIIQHLDTDQFTRIRIGVGRPSSPELAADYVLSSFKKNELKDINESIDQAVLVIEQSL